VVKPEHSPITGREDKKDLPPTIRALSEFYEAFNRRDLEKLSQNWAHTDEVAMDNPVGGIMRGWEAIRAVYERIFNGPARVNVEFHDYTLHEAGEIFYAVGRERGEFRAGETVVNLAIRTSRIYRLIDGQWRQVHHHGSIDEPELLAQYQKAVRGDS
jgi:ketosteroid isomerase-like protein